MGTFIEELECKDIYFDEPGKNVYCSTPSGEDRTIPDSVLELNELRFNQIGKKTTRIEPRGSDTFTVAIEMEEVPDGERPLGVESIQE